MAGQRWNTQLAMMLRLILLAAFSFRCSQQFAVYAADAAISPHATIGHYGWSSLRCRVTVFDATARHRTALLLMSRHG